MKANRWYIIPLMQEVETNLTFLTTNNDFGIETSKELLRAVQDQVIKNLGNIKSKKDFRNLDFTIATYEALADIMGA